ncbi:MAG TPA: vWA domain-containing protein [Polyangiaceae bacterium]|nr:vWA domain-containing protein [Polyangiaceae bacterium]
MKPTPSASTTPLPPTPTSPPMPTAHPCESVNLDVDQLRPAVTLLVDQSGSMAQGYPSFDSPQTRWSTVRQALLDPTTGVVKSLQQSLQFGLTFYTSHNGFSGGACPLLSEVRSATGNYASIAALYDQTWPDDDTPTGPAITQVVKEIQRSGRQGPELILLVTDGEPDTCTVPDPQMGQPEALGAAAAAHDAGIGFYVLGVGTDISESKLQELANAGQGKRVDAQWGVDADAAEPFRASLDVAGLTAQLLGILARVPLCEVLLDRDVSQDEMIRGRVAVDGRQLAYQSPDGFRLLDPRHLQIVGQACDSLRASGKRVTVRISCD